MYKLLLIIGILFTSCKTFTIVDYKTNETLTGVKIIKGSKHYYSDFDGKVKTNINVKNIDISYPSYELFNVKNDSIFLVQKIQ